MLYNQKSKTAGILAAICFAFGLCFFVVLLFDNNLRNFLIPATIFELLGVCCCIYAVITGQIKRK